MTAKIIMLSNVNRGRSKGNGTIVISLTESGEFYYRHRGSLSHIEKVGMLTMALHSMEYKVMAGGDDE
jgi:hypothetical protein